jgi:hypothetical protein
MRISTDGMPRALTLGLDEPVPGGTLPIIAVDSRTPEDIALRAEIESAVADAVAKLPTALRDVFTRCTVFGLPIRDTAEALGLTVQATKTHLFRARLQLRQELQKALGGGSTLATSRIGFRSLSQIEMTTTAAKKREWSHIMNGWREAMHEWAVILAGGDGTRLRELSYKVSGDYRPKQFCEFFGGKSLLAHTRDRLQPRFRDENTFFVLNHAPNVLLEGVG